MTYPNFSELTIKEIKEYTAELSVDNSLLELSELLEQDSRIGVNKIAKRLRNKLAKKQAVIDKFEKMSQQEIKLYQEGYQAVVGIDEAGRGPLAGPVVAAAVILDQDNPIYGLDDSKKLSRERREELLEEIREKAFRDW